MNYQESDKIVRSVVDYMNSPEGQEQLKKDLADTHEVIEQLRIARRISIETLLQPMTI